VIGLGSGSLTGTEQEMADVISTAIDSSINYFSKNYRSDSFCLAIGGYFCAG